MSNLQPTTQAATPIDFDEVIDRRGTNSRKWDAMEEVCGVPADVGIPLWVADMDFRPPPSVTRALSEAIDRGVYGYFGDRSSYHASIIAWMQRRHGWAVEEDWIVTGTGGVAGMHNAVRAFCEPGDGVILQPPVYYPFYWAAKHNDARIVSNPLQVVEDGRARMDLEQLERAIDDRTRMILLCSPHNPGGRVWTRDELSDLVALCTEHDLIIVSDEVHHDLVYSGHTHTVLASLSDAAAERTVVLSGAMKTFNLAGLQIGNAIIPNPELRKRYARKQEGGGIFGPNLFGVHASRAAYDEGDAWLDALLVYLEASRDLVAATLAERLPQVRCTPLDGTYLAWLDCGGLGLPMDEVNRRLEQEAHLALNHGDVFGEGGEQFVRLNFALPRPVLNEALERFVQVFS